MILLGALLDAPCRPILKEATPGRDSCGTSLMVGLTNKTELATLFVVLASTYGAFDG